MAVILLVAFVVTLVLGARAAGDLLGGARASPLAWSLVESLKGLFLAAALGLGVIELFGLRGADTASDAAEMIVDRHTRRRQYALWFIQLRWVAAAVALGLITVGSGLPRAVLFSWWGGLVLANLLFGWWTRHGTNYELQIVVQAAVDLIILTGFLNGSGGLENPLYMSYVFHVILAGILLPKVKAAWVTGFAVLLFSLLSLGEYTRVLPHYTNVLFPHVEQGASATAGAEHAGSDDEAVSEADHHASHDLFYVAGRTLPFLGVLVLTAYFTNLIMGRVRRTEAGLERSARESFLERCRLEGVVEASGIGMMQLDGELRVMWFNRRTAYWLGWEEKVVGKSCPLLSDCPDCVAKRALRSGRQREEERVITAAEGRRRHLRLTARPVQDGEGRTVQIVEVLEDVTERKALEAEAIRSGKLSALGRMAAGIAHEIGNPLSSISTRLSLIERRCDEPYLDESVAVLRQQIERISGIVRGVSHFARVRPREASRWPLDGLIEEGISVATLDRRAKEIRFEVRNRDPGLQVRGVRDHISQVFLNLLLNAVEAMLDGGTVTVESRSRDGWALFTVEDEGSGIELEARNHLFEPFFTTKSEGTGLGLAISHSLVTAHGGRIEVESPAGAGARFSVFLPLDGATESPGDEPRKTKGASMKGSTSRETA